jgi:hypothetical protein
VPTFFTARFNQNPSDIYSYSPFVAAINTIATRIQVINELYRITQVVGYPRMDVTVLEEVLLKSAPPLLRTDAKATRQFIDNQMAQIRATFQNMRADETLVHTDAVEVDMVNDSRPGDVAADPERDRHPRRTEPRRAEDHAGSHRQIEQRSGRLNRGPPLRLELRRPEPCGCGCLESGADPCRPPRRLPGPRRVRVRAVELRPVLELEPQKTMKQSRLEQALSRGYITDDEFHIDVFGRPRPATAPELSGTNFAQPQPAASVDPSQQSPNGDSLGRGMAPEGGTKQAKSNTVKSGAGKTAPNGK